MGLPKRQIARRLFLSEKTVRNYISTILGKLHANDRTEAALIAARYGLGAQRSDDSAPKVGTP
jgi:two-component system response regulator DevR